jgi:hypothetical protein
VIKKYICSVKKEKNTNLVYRYKCPKVNKTT